MTARRQGHRWQPITDLPEALARAKFPELDGLLAAFGKRRQDLDAARAIDAYTQRLVRSWSIETGILENLYTLGDSVTLTLVEHGFDAALISHGDTNLPAGRLIEILRDHQEAADGLFAFVNGRRALGTSYVKELHQVLTRHQATCDAVDSQGNFVHVPLRRGEWKLHPNNPGDVGGGVARHQYCPPEQTASEMDRLVAMHAAHDDVHPVVEAAWLHHRFTQIHPFQDGNGRVARALASLVCIRGGGFPVVVMRQQKLEYIRALETADEGDLGPLVAMFEKWQNRAFTRSISLSDEAVEEAQDMDAILADAKRRLTERAPVGAEPNEHRAALMDDAQARFEQAAQAIASQLAPRVTATVSRSSDVDARRYEMAVLEAAKWHDYAPNLGSPQSWVALDLEYEGTSSVIVAFHHLGAEDLAVVVASAVLILSDGVRHRARTTLYEYEFPGDRPLTFTPRRERAELRGAFAAWLERALTGALSYWRRAL